MLISSSYEDAMTSVDRSLQEITGTLKHLLKVSESNTSSAQGFVNVDPASMSRGMTSEGTVATGEGFKGDSSFQAHVQKVTESLRAAAARLEFGVAEAEFASTGEETTPCGAKILDPDGPTGSEITMPVRPVATKHPDTQDRKLPPMDSTLKLLRLSKTERQRMFIDVPVIDKIEFTQICQKVYFAVDEYSIWAWVLVNVGLFFLFTDLKNPTLAELRLTMADVEAQSELLVSNIESAIMGIKLVHDPSIMACQALALLVSLIHSLQASTDCEGYMVQQTRTERSRVADHQCSIKNVYRHGSPPSERWD